MPLAIGCCTLLEPAGDDKHLQLGKRADRLWHFSKFHLAKITGAIALWFQDAIGYPKGQEG
jgi:hypothetical protein